MQIAGRFRGALGSRKSTTPATATTVRAEVARRDKAQLCGVVHVTTIGHRTWSVVGLSPALDPLARTYSCLYSGRGPRAVGTAGHVIANDG